MDNKNKGGGLTPFTSLIIGGVLLLVGIFLLFQNTRVSASWHVWRIGSFGLPTGVTVLPLLVGIGLWVYRPKWVVGKIVTAAGILFILLTIFFSVHIQFMSTGLFNYILMFGCIAVGVALILRGWLDGRKKDDEEG